MAAKHPNIYNGSGSRTRFFHVGVFAHPPSARAGTVSIGQVKFVLHSSGKRKGKRS